MIFVHVILRYLLELFLTIKTLNEPIPLACKTVVGLSVQYILYQSGFYDNFQVINVKAREKICWKIGVGSIEKKD